jgi:hypothetical protein
MTVSFRANGQVHAGETVAFFHEEGVYPSRQPTGRFRDACNSLVDSLPHSGNKAAVVKVTSRLDGTLTFNDRAAAQIADHSDGFSDTTGAASPSGTKD